MATDRKSDVYRTSPAGKFDVATEYNGAPMFGASHSPPPFQAAEEMRYPAASRNLAAAASGVMSRCGEPSISKPTMNFRIVAERRSGG